jgi:hypothetical protein
MVGDGLIVMASNNGVVNLTGNTSILAKSGDDALAVGWAYPQMTSYIDGTQVTVNTTGKIDGGVYMCFWSETCKTTTNKSTLTIKNGTFNGDLTIADGFDTNNLIIKGGTFNGENWPSQTVTTTK